MNLFCDKDLKPLALGSEVTWYSRRYKSHIRGTVQQLRAHLDWKNRSIIKITVRAEYPNGTSWVVLSPSSVFRTSAI